MGTYLPAWRDVLSVLPMLSCPVEGRAGIGGIAGRLAWNLDHMLKGWEGGWDVWMGLSDG